jgi:GTPase
VYTSIIMIFEEYKINLNTPATLVSIVAQSFQGHQNLTETENSLIELKELLKTLDIKPSQSFIQKRQKLDPATIIGKGKLLEIKESAQKNNSKLIVFDFDLTAGQLKNVKAITKMDVLDRCSIILEIFAQHSRTKEAKMQIEIAKLEYFLPRLKAYWSHFSRQKGVIGLRGGEGEQQIELDRRIIKDRISILKKQVKEIKVHRTEQTKRRNKNSITAAIIGYTNAGKSSIMNQLCNVDMLAENKLFATLDSVHRAINPNSKPPLILADTVGFISNLPAFLVNGFKTTFQSSLDADLLIIVCDLSDVNYKKHLEITESLVNELGAKAKQRLYVFNKSDLVDDKLKCAIVKKNYPDALIVSSLSKSDMINLRDKILEVYLAQQNLYDLYIPYEKSQEHSKVYSFTNIQKVTHHEKGTYYQVRTPEFIYSSLQLQSYNLQENENLRNEFVKISKIN